jgi:hypothetical protein
MSSLSNNIVFQIDTDYEFLPSEICEIFYKESIGKVLRMEEFVSDSSEKHYIYIVYCKKIYDNSFTQSLLQFLNLRWNIRYEMTVKRTFLHKTIYPAFYISLYLPLNQVTKAIRSYQNFLKEVEKKELNMVEESQSDESQSDESQSDESQTNESQSDESQSEDEDFTYI